MSQSNKVPTKTITEMVLDQKDKRGQQAFRPLEGDWKKADKFLFNAAMGYYICKDCGNVFFSPMHIKDLEKLIEKRKVDEHNKIIIPKIFPGKCLKNR